MASSISYEYLASIEGTPNGLATLDGDGKIPASQLPSIAEVYKGEFATSPALIAAFPTAAVSNYARVDSTSSWWYWNAALATPAWVNQQISIEDYLLLSTAEKAGVPYIIEP